MRLLAYRDSPLQIRNCFNNIHAKNHYQLTYFTLHFIKHLHMQNITVREWYNYLSAIEHLEIKNYPPIRIT